MDVAVKQQKFGLTAKILVGMALGIVVGLLIRYQQPPDYIYDFFVNGLFSIGGIIFINIMKMLIVPVVFISLIGGISSIGEPKQLGRLGLKTLLLYLLTTSIAITMALLLANLFGIGSGSHLTSNINSLTPPPHSLKTTIINMVPQNPFQAMVDGNMLQIIVFSILFGFAITLSGNAGKNIKLIFKDFECVVLKLVIMMLEIAPLWCVLFTRQFVCRTRPLLYR